MILELGKASPDAMSSVSLTFIYLFDIMNLLTCFSLSLF